jgi:hypothetical protein
LAAIAAVLPIHSVPRVDVRAESLGEQSGGFFLRTSEQTGELLKPFHGLITWIDLEQTGTQLRPCIAVNDEPLP